MNDLLISRFFYVRRFAHLRLGDPLIIVFFVVTLFFIGCFVLVCIMVDLVAITGTLGVGRQFITGLHAHAFAPGGNIEASVNFLMFRARGQTSGCNKLHTQTVTSADEWFYRHAHERSYIDVRG